MHRTPSGGTIFLLVKKDSGERHAKGPAGLRRCKLRILCFRLRAKSAVAPLRLLSPANPLTLGSAGAPVF